MDIVQKLYNWSKNKLHDRKLHKFGGLQWCPWCKQCAQDGDGWKFETWQEQPFHDVLTCGVCSGTSVWHWCMGMQPVIALEPPKENNEWGIASDNPSWIVGTSKATQTTNKEVSDVNPMAKRI